MIDPRIFAVDCRLHWRHGFLTVRQAEAAVRTGSHDAGMQSRHGRESEGRMYFRDSLGSVLRRGFTLVEILVVLVLMGLMAGLVAPSIIGPSDDSGSQMRELVRSASAAAVKRGEVVQLSLASTGQWKLLGTASSPPDEIASGRLERPETAMTLLFSPLGTCAPDLKSEEAAATLALDPIMCDLPAEQASQ